MPPQSVSYDIGPDEPTEKTRTSARRIQIARIFSSYSGLATREAFAPLPAYKSQARNKENPGPGLGNGSESSATITAWAAGFFLAWGDLAHATSAFHRAFFLTWAAQSGGDRRGCDRNEIRSDDRVVQRKRAGRADSWTIKQGGLEWNRRSLRSRARTSSYRLVKLYRWRFGI
jgi:hypothetical protein